MSKEVVLKHPCMTMCRVTNEIVIRTRGGAEVGEGEIGGVKGKGIASTITCNLAAPATHHLISAIPRI